MYRTFQFHNHIDLYIYIHIQRSTRDTQTHLLPGKEKKRQKKRPNHDDIYTSRNANGITSNNSWFPRRGDEGQSEQHMEQNQAKKKTRNEVRSTH